MLEPGLNLCSFVYVRIHRDVIISDTGVAVHTSDKLI